MQQTMTLTIYQKRLRLPKHQARQNNISMESGIHYKDIRVRRVPWADKYEDVDEIPVEELLDHGWYFICNICGARIEDITVFYTNNKGFCCKKCFDEWEEGE